MSELAARLTEIVGLENLGSDAAVREKYGRDWTRFFPPAPSLVVFPRNIETVLRLVKFANEDKISLVPSGGRTGLSGGAVATDGEIVVSFEKMNQVLQFNEVDNTVVVEPGLITQQLQEFATQKGLFYPVDFASSGSSQIGGNIATNAGGIKVLRYGLTRDWVRGLKVVTGSGELLDLNKGLIKNATGYDLRHLFIGSEGTLGFIVEATMALTKPPNDLTVVLLAVHKMTDVISILEVFKNKVELTAFEFFSDEALRHVIDMQGANHPFPEQSRYYVLLEFERTTAEVPELAHAAFSDCVSGGWVADGVISQSERQRDELWSYRENIAQALTPFTPYKNDVAVRVSQVPGFLAAIEGEVGKRYPAFEVIWFGHIGDGNLHLNILKPADWDIDDFKRDCEKVSQSVLAIVKEFDGSISAEHGVGLLKRDQLEFTRSYAEIELMKSLKAVFDPGGIMNPGKLLF